MQRKNTIFYIFLIIVLMISSIGFSSCQAQMSKSLLGIWETSLDSGISERLEINEDETFTWTKNLSDKNGTTELLRFEGTYTIEIDYFQTSMDPLLILKYKKDSKTLEDYVHFSIEGNGIILTRGNKNTLYEKIQLEASNEG